MKKFRRFLITIVVILVCLQMTNALYFASYAWGDETNGVSAENIPDDILKPIISSPISNVSEAIRVSFDAADILSYSIQTEGLNAVEVSGDLISYDITAIEEFGALNFYATYEDDVVKQSSVYIYKYDNVVYVSDVSEEQAWYDCMKQRFDNEEITADEFQYLYEQLTNRYCCEYIPENDVQNENNVSNGVTVVYGKITWKLDESKSEDFINSKVELIKLVDGNEIIIGTTYTLTDGSFRFEIVNDEWSSSGEDIFIRWRLESITYAIKTDWYIDHYYFNSGTRYNVLPGTTEYFNEIIDYKESSTHCKAAYLHQVMTIAERFAMEMSTKVSDYINSGNSKLEVAYPAEIVGDSAFCFGNDFKSISMIGALNYDKIDCITHEYGHYVQYIMNTYGATIAEIINNSPMHEVYADHFFDKSVKEYAMELTWSEAWACVFSVISQNYYTSASEYTHFNNLLSYFYMSYNLENPNNHDEFIAFDNNNKDSIGEQDNRGEAQELAVAAFLYDLYDNTNEDFDNISWGYQTWWDCTTVEGMYTLEDFVTYMSDEYPQMRNDMAMILSEHKISPEITSVSSYSAEIAPTIMFIVNGSEEHPNNRFIIYFYDEDGEYIGESPMIESSVAHRSIVSYSIPADVWQRIRISAGVNCITTKQINMSVGGYRYDNDFFSDEIRKLSGPYFSPYYETEIIYDHNYQWEYVDNNYHWQSCSRCGSKFLESHDFKYTIVDDIYHIKTCECGDTSGEREMHTLRASTAKPGYKECIGCGAYIYVGGIGGGIYPVSPYKNDDFIGETTK